VDQINFEIQKGEILGLLGPNGAGKTTTLRMLTGFLQPTSGSIRVKDFTIDSNMLEIKKLLGYLPESAPLYHDMLVFDYLEFVAAIRNIRSRERYTRIQQLADLCRINEVVHQPIAELSKGYKQRVGLAHAMIDDPEVLVLDEPTSGLDPNQIVEIRKIIKRIGKEKTIILSTHILSEAEATCDRIVIINQGKIVADGNTASLKESISAPKLIHLTMRDTDFQAVQNELAEITGIMSIDAIEEAENHLEVQITCQANLDIRADIYRKIKQTDWTLLDFHQESQTLETIFQKLTKEN
jgi:ABC-2 type transport system ATP-binding protein